VDSRSWPGRRAAMTTASRVSLDHLPLPAPGLRLAMTYDEYLAWAPETMLAEWTVRPDPGKCG